ncbi:acetyltransferase (GNAT) family protein [Humibacillus xanthopallidus]|uniref:Acetyltransferase (GNAT) family protein n=1 Tax=Humibacillus xanthopallidus TaxID=412689 RepID=A0A543PWK3_9MICO|nr:GNAT family N-acetyltransferase [Humibacillus xanthopallidus]TQN48467.1 acetyltransferase (GNAT) family protein [Humibacillus xanthopallidus]
MGSGPDLLARVHDRSYRGDDDFWLVRGLLLDTYPITPVDFNWEIRRWDGQRFYREHQDPDPDAAARIHLWEGDGGRLVGAVHEEDAGNAFLELHPDYRHIEEEMIVWAEEHLAVTTGDGAGRQLNVFAFDYDVVRRRILERRGFERLPGGAVTRRLRLGNRSVPTAQLPLGYNLRTTRPGVGDAQRIADLLNAAFDRTIHTAAEYQAFTSSSPSFRHDLDLVAEGPDGSFAAYAGVTYDSINRRGIFEPVCTDPRHQRRGLARALMLEGIRRVRALGAADVYVSTGDQNPAGELYDSVGFTESYSGASWRRAW